MKIVVIEPYKIGSHNLRGLVNETLTNIENKVTPKQNHLNLQNIQN
jgi:hypothetical protein